ncbi:hypothetical protein WDZ92_53645, partial [Nostoc sp. NIES-2111]
VILLYLTYIKQGKELEATRMIAQKQASTQDLAQFESTYFNYISILNSLLSELKKKGNDILV